MGIGLTWLWLDQEKNVYSLLRSTTSCDVSLAILLSVFIYGLWITNYQFVIHNPLWLLLYCFHHLSVDVQGLINICFGMLITKEPGLARIMVGHNATFDRLLS